MTATLLPHYLAMVPILVVFVWWKARWLNISCNAEHNTVHHCSSVSVSLEHTYDYLYHPHLVLFLFQYLIYSSPFIDICVPLGMCFWLFVENIRPITSWHFSYCLCQAGLSRSRAVEILAGQVQWLCSCLQQCCTTELDLQGSLVCSKCACVTALQW